MNLLTIENGELRLNTNLDEYTFGKTAHDAVLSQEGALFDGKNFRQWSFEEVKSYDAAKIGSATGSVERLVFYCTKNPLGKNAKTLAQYLDEGGEPALKAVLAVCTALTAAATDGYQLPMVGAGGIMVDGDTILFAPESLFVLLTGLSIKNLLLLLCLNLLTVLLLLPYPYVSRYSAPVLFWCAYSSSRITLILYHLPNNNFCSFL